MLNARTTKPKQAYSRAPALRKLPCLENGTISRGRGVGQKNAMSLNETNSNEELPAGARRLYVWPAADNCLRLPPRIIHYETH